LSELTDRPLGDAAGLKPNCVEAVH